MADIIEQRTVCDACGQAFGGFHKGCDGAWVTERRTVTPWERTRNTIRASQSWARHEAPCGEAFYTAADLEGHRLLCAECP